jgi:hypothetical protein
MFNTAKKGFILKYPGLINALNNTFNNVEVKKGFLSQDDEVYLKKDFVIGNSQFDVFFHVSQNKNKFDDIGLGIDFDYLIHNKRKPGKGFNLNSKMDFCDIDNKQDYIKYLNHLGIKNHLLSKYKGEYLMDFEKLPDSNLETLLLSKERWERNKDPNTFEQYLKNDYEQSFKNISGKDNTTNNTLVKFILEKNKKDIKSMESYEEAKNNKMLWHINTLKNNGTNYDALGKPLGVKHQQFKFNNFKYITFNNHTIESFDYENADFLNGYKHKSNFVLHIEIKNKKSILYQSFTLLDSNKMSEITLTDYDNIKNKLDEFLESFESSVSHKNLSNNLNVRSLVYELTGKNYTKLKINNPTNSSKSNTMKSNSLEYMNSTLIHIKTKMRLFFSTEIGRFESNGYNLIHGNFLSPPDHIILLDALKLVEEALWNSLAGLVAEVGAQSIYGKFLTDKWDNLIDESKQEELNKFLNGKNIKLIKFHDEPNDDQSLYLG